VPGCHRGEGGSDFIDVLRPVLKSGAGVQAARQRPPSQAHIAAASSLASRSTQIL
jgi:hypothetical protein